MIHKRSYCWVISSRGFTAPQIEAPASDVIDWRRRIHAHPELSYKEHATSDFVVEKLTSFGLFPERPTETSVTVLIQGRGRVAQWRCARTWTPCLCRGDRGLLRLHGERCHARVRS